MADIKAGSLKIDLAMDVAQIRTNTKDAADVLSRFHGDVKNAMSGVQKLLVIDLALKGFHELESLADSFVELAEKGEKLESVTKAFERLGGSAESLDKAREASYGLIGTMDLLTQANQGLLAQVPHFNENVSQIAGLGAKIGKSLGGDAASGFTRLTQALISGQAAELKALGFTIDLKKAFHDFQVENDLVGVSLDKLQKKMAVSAQAMKQLGDVNERLGPITLGVADAHSKMERAISGAFTKIGKGINESEQFAKAFDDLREAVNSIDWELIGRRIGDLASILRVVTVPIRVATQAVSELASALNEAAFPGSSAKHGAISQFNELVNAQFGLKTSGQAKEQLDKLHALAESAGSLLPADKIKQLDAYFSHAASTLPKVVKDTEDFDTNLSGAGNSAKKAADEIERSVNAYNKLREKSAAKQLGSEIQDAIKSGMSLDELLQEFSNQVANPAYQKTLESMHAGIVAGKIDLKQAVVEADVEAQGEVIKQITEPWKKFNSENAEDLQRKLEKVHEDAVESWSSFFTDAFNGDASSLTDLFKKAAVGFASELTAQLSGDASPLSPSNAASLGTSLAKGLGQAIFGNSPADGMGPSLPGLGDGGSLSGLNASLSQLTAGANTAGAYVTALTAAKGDLEKVGKSRSETIKGLSGAGGAAIGAYFGGPIGAQVGEKIGDAVGRGLAKVFGGGRNATDQAIHDLAGKLEEMIASVGGLRLINGSGTKTLSNITEGSKSSAAFDNLSSSAKGTFSAFADGLKEIEGITKDVGDTFTRILADNIGSVDNLRLAVAELGLSEEDFQKAFLKNAEQGKIRWAEYNAEIAGIRDAFKPGLAAVGAYKQAVDNLWASGGRGIAATKSVTDAAVEGIEAGLTTVKQLGDKLIAEGEDPAKIQALVQAAAQHGVTTLKQLAALNTQQAGEIVGSIEGLSSAVADSWKKMGESIDELSNKIKDFPKEVESTIHLKADIDPQITDTLSKVKANGGSVPDLGASGSIQAHALGGIIESPTLMRNRSGLHLAGESGVEAIMPLRRINGRLGVSTDGMAAPNAGHTVNISIDARGQSGDVEASLQSIADTIHNNVIDAIVSMSQRGAI